MSLLNSTMRRVVVATFTHSRRVMSSNTTSHGGGGVVVLGTGWGGFNLARSLDKLSVVSPSNHFVFTPLVPSTAVGTLEFRAVQEPIRTLPSVASYYQAKARSVDLDKQIVTCEGVWDGEVFEVPYEKLVLAQGVKTNTFGVPNVAEREGKEVFFLKVRVCDFIHCAFSARRLHLTSSSSFASSLRSLPHSLAQAQHLHHARAIRNRTIEMFEVAALPGVCDDEKRRLLSFVIVGGGPTSCEYASELHDFLVKDISR